MNLKVNYKKIISLIILIFFINTIFATEDSLKIISPFYFGDEEKVYEDINYLENEYLSFKFCTDKESKNINFETTCKNMEKTSLNVYKYLSSVNSEMMCYFSNYELEKIPCDEFSLEINYENNNKIKQIKRTFKKQRESKLINHILNNNYEDISSPLDLSYYLTVLNNLEDLENKKSIDVYEKLKNIRNNENKCWPSSSCNLETSTKILNNLKIAGYTDNSRLIEDGKIYLEKKIISDDETQYPDIADSIEVYEFNLHIEHNFSSSVDCDLIIDDEDEKTYKFDDGDDYFELIINGNIENKLELTCDEEIDKIILKQYEEKIYSNEYSNDDSFNYLISDNDQSEFGEINYEIKIEHTFAINETFACDLIIDDEEIELEFDEDSDNDDLLITGEIMEDIDFDCNGDKFDKIFFQIYGGSYNEEEITNDDYFEYEVPGSNTASNSFNFKIDFKYDFDTNDKVVCDLKTDNGIAKVYTFDKDDETSNNLYIDKKSASSTINFVCDKELKEINLKVYDKYNRVQVNEKNTDSKSIVYTISSDFSKYSCVGENNLCNYKSSIDSLSTYGSSLEDYTLIEKYIDSLIQTENDETTISSSNKNLDNGKYLYFKNNEDLVNYLKFKQNNDGSWGTNSPVNKISESAWAVLGLQKIDMNSEYVEDGKKWIYFNEPINGWGNIEKNSLAYLAIKEQIKPYLKITITNEINKFSKIDINNPTILNLKDIVVEFDKDLNEHLSYSANLGDLAGNSNISFNITPEEGFIGEMSGDMIISGINGKNEKIELIKMPINIKGGSAFTLKTQNNYSLSEDSRFVKIDIIKSTPDIESSCTYINPFSLATENVKIDKMLDSININNLELKSGFFESELICNLNGIEFKTPFS
ncbi:MAG: hypothetical protein KC550_03890, partial [Nanoarchaeota archaeon]|nr:hypothetical protein [Nanoarchaeota archaeon]